MSCVIDIDFQRGFMKAEIIFSEDLMGAGSLARPSPTARCACREEVAS